MYDFEPKSQQHVQHANVSVLEKISNPNEHVKKETLQMRKL